LSLHITSPGNANGTPIGRAIREALLGTVYSKHNPRRTGKVHVLGINADHMPPFQVSRKSRE
jgi:hypothetical protein